MLEALRVDDGGLQGIRVLEFEDVGGHWFPPMWDWFVRIAA